MNTAINTHARFPVDGKRIKDAIALARVIGVRSNMPLLESVRITGDCGALAIEATDLYVSMRMVLGCDAVSGSACVRIRALADALKPVKGKASASLGFNAGGLFVGAAHLNPSCDSKDWPATVNMDGAHEHELPRAEFSAALEAVLPAMSLDTTRGQLNSVFIDHGTLVATDGCRMHVAALPFGSIASELLLSARFATVLAKALKISDRAGNFALRRNATHVQAVIGRLVITGQLETELRFPNYKRVIPTKKSSTASAQLRTADLLTAIEQVTPCVPESGACTLTVREHDIGVSCDGNDRGHAAATAACDVRRGGGVTVGVNARYLREALGATDALTVALRFGAPADPIVLETKQGFLALIMPMKM